MEISVVWLRRDLRLHDNEAIARAASARKNCLYVFVIDPWFFTQAEIGWLRIEFLFESLAALDRQLNKSGNRLVVLKGESTATVQQLLETLETHRFRPHLYFNRDIQVEYGRQRDQTIESYCKQHTVPLRITDNFFLLDDEKQMDGWWRAYYEYQNAQQHEIPALQKPDSSVYETLELLPLIRPQRTAGDLELHLPQPHQALFAGGENEARKALFTFLKDRVDGYRWKISRPYLAQRGATSLLGPHLAFGTISNRTVFQAAANHRAKLESRKPKKAFDIATYLDRLRWRDSFTQRLWFHPELIWKNRFPEFDDIYNQGALDDQQQEYFERWKQGQTGFPLLDAAMVQLKHDGFINFRMRAMAASFLTINCGVSWHHGARYFMNCLVDGDIAINHWQWQMQAGITNPLSPTFRIYSPTKNLRDRDPYAEYVHFWLPQTRGKNVDTILRASKPMLDFNQTRKVNGKLISDTRKKIRQRIIVKEGIDFQQAKATHKAVTNYTRFSADRYKTYAKEQHV